MKNLIKKISIIRSAYPNATIKIESVDGIHIVAAVGYNTGCFVASTSIERNTDESFEDAKLRAFEEACEMAGIKTDSSVTSISVAPTRRRRNRKVVAPVGSVAITDLTGEPDSNTDQINLFDVVAQANNQEQIDAEEDNTEIESENEDASIEAPTDENPDENPDENTIVEEIPEEISEGNSKEAPTEEPAEAPAENLVEPTPLERPVVSPKSEDDKLELAMRFVVPFGREKGKTLGDLLEIRNGLNNIKWYAFEYNGNNLELKRAAKLVYKAANN